MKNGGSYSITDFNFKDIQNLVQYEKVEVLDTKFSELSSNLKFDFILLNFVVDHLNEKCCELLLKSEKARAYYVRLFREMRRLLKPNGRLIITDCSPINYRRNLPLSFIRN